MEGKTYRKGLVNQAKLQHTVNGRPAKQCEQNHLQIKQCTKLSYQQETHIIPSGVDEMGHHALAGSYLSMDWDLANEASEGEG